MQPGGLAVAVLGLEGGALVGLPAGAALVARLGSRASLRLAFAVYPTALPAVALAPGLGWLAAALAVMAAANSVIDVAMNAQGVELERRYRRPILSGLHAAHPFGMLAGGLVGTAAAAADLAVGPHFGLAGGCGLVAGLAATRWLVAEPDRPRRRLLARPSGRLLLLGVIAFCAFLLDGTANNWSAAQLHGERGAAPALAAAGFSAFTAALALAGWATLGAGLAAMAPAVLGATPAVGRAPLPVAIAAVTTLGYLGSFTGPPLVGALAEVTGLSAALGLLMVAAAVPVLLAGRALGPRGTGEAVDRQPSLR